MTREAYKKHKKVINWFYNQPEGTKVLEKNRILETWKELEDPIFSVENDYLINDEYVELRKAIYNGKEIESFDVIDSKWKLSKVTNPNIDFSLKLKHYRISQKNTYPVFKKNDFMIVKFINKEKSKIVFIFDKDKALSNAKVITPERLLEINIKDINDEQWEDVLYDKERGLWDGQPIWCFYFDKSLGRDLRFNNVKDNTVFNFRGERAKINEYNYFEPYPHLIDDWVIEAYNRLEF